MYGVCSWKRGMSCCQGKTSKNKATPSSALAKSLDEHKVSSFVLGHVTGLRLLVIHR